MKKFTKSILASSFLLLLQCPVFAGDKVNNPVSKNTVTEYAPPCTLSAFVNNINTYSCMGNPNGSLAAVPNSGTPPYTYSWAPSGGTKDTAMNLTAGTYTVTVTDANSCTAIASASVITDVVTVTVRNDTTCALACGGTLNAVCMGGHPGYTYFWDNGATTSSMTSLCVSTHTLTIMDQSGCMATGGGSVINFPNIPSLTVTPTINNATCPGTFDGSISLSASAPSSPFRYLWDQTNYGGNTLNNVGSGTYTCVISDQFNNCNVLNYTVGSNNTCGYINGKTFNDTNFNCIYNGEPGLVNSFVTITPGNYVVFPDFYGNYSQNAPYGNYTVTQTINPGSPFAACSSSLPVTVSSSTPAVNFADTTHANLSDPMIRYLISSQPIIGQPLVASFQVFNNGSDTSFGSVYFVLPDSVTFISTTPPYLLHSNDTIYWNYPYLLPGDSLNYSINCTVITNAQLLNYRACEYAAVIPSNSESNAQNDFMWWCNVFANAVDPNNKAVSPPGQGPYGYILPTDSVLTYTIHFQNTGTAAASNIFIVDTISSYLNVNTLRVLGASNTFSYIVTGNRVRFIFSNINLPDSSTSPNGSSGWIQYKVNQNNNNVGGDSIKNTAYIYFDYNAAVVTNTTINTINLTTNSAKINPAKNVSVYPNPSNGIFKMQIRNYELGITN